MPSQSGRVVYSSVLAACCTDGRGFETQTSNNPHGHIDRYADQKVLTAMLASIQSTGVAPQVNLSNSMQTRKHVSEKSTLDLKPRTDITRSPKQGVSVTPQKGLMSFKMFKKIVNGWVVMGFFPLKSLQKSQASQHPLKKLLYSLKILCVGLFSK